MILQALHAYYERMLGEPESDMPAYGASIENISFALVLGLNGNLCSIEDLREQDGNKLRPRKLPVPAAVTRTSGVKANFIWDKAGYVLGADCEGASEQNKQRFQAFRELLDEVGKDVKDPGFSAVRTFIGNWKAEQAQTLIERYQSWEDACSANLVFRLDGVPGFIHGRPPIQKAWLDYCRKTSDAPLVQCLINGEKNVPQARIHTPIKGVRGGQTSGGYIVSFNATAFISYGKDKDYNASVSEDSAFAYTTALNALLTEKSRQKIIVGDTTFAFWAERSSPAEAFLSDLIETPNESTEKIENEDDRLTSEKIFGLLKAIRDGKRPTDIVPELDDSVRFYILGVSPNAARISIRFWETNTLGNLLTRIGKHYEQLAIVRQYDTEPNFPPLWLLLRQIAPLGKTENISPVLAGGMARAMLTDGRYPQNLLAAVLQRIRAEHSVTYFRAALLKAFLIRNKGMEVPMALNPDRTDRPYLLGRLFAVIEKAQEEAIPNTNATVKERYLASASATPGRIFHILLKNFSNHIAKLRKDPAKKGWAFHYESMSQDIIAGFDDYPAIQSPEDQGLFMIGYYHQRKDFYTKKNQEDKS